MKMIGHLSPITSVVVLLVAQVTQAKPQQYLHGGFIAAEGQFPYQVSVRQYLFRDNEQTPYGSIHLCGGAIIGERHIVTAAHCLVNRTISDTFVVTGSTALSNHGQKHTAKKLISHENYSYSKSAPDDIAVIALNYSIVFNAYQNVIALASGPPEYDAYATIAGWGYAEHGSGPEKYPAQLQYLLVKTMNIAECRKYHDKHAKFYTFQFCAFPGHGNGACSGDSGSPVVQDDVLIGIVSYGKKYCAEGYPEILSSVYHYRPWLRHQMLTT